MCAVHCYKISIVSQYSVPSRNRLPYVLLNYRYQSFTDGANLNELPLHDLSFTSTYTAFHYQWAWIKALSGIGVDLAGILRRTRDERRRWVGA